MATPNSNKHMSFDTALKRYLCTQHLVTIVAQAEKRIFFTKTTLYQGTWHSFWSISTVILQQDKIFIKRVLWNWGNKSKVGSSFLVVTEHWQPEQRPRPRVRQSWPSWSFLRQPSVSTVFNLVSPSLLSSSQLTTFSSQYVCLALHTRLLENCQTILLLNSKNNLLICLNHWLCPYSAKFW